MRDSSAAAPSPQRRLVHRRSLSVEVYARDDGLWDLQAELRDVKTRDLTLSERTRPAGVPVHDMLLIVTINDALDIVDARSHTLFSPYDTCGDHGDAYARLIGLNLLRGFRAAVRERLGGVLGCTHLTELTQILPTAAIQGLAGLTQIALPVAENDRPADMPFQLNRCHALRLDGPAVAEFYPRWAQPAVPQRAKGTMPTPQVEDETP
ncbi:MAG: DUF2889 domain-containing protein [Pseudomonadota bacterium]